MDKIEINVDVMTGEVTQTVSQFTAEELAYSAQVNEQLAIATEQAETTKSSALNKLMALGLTEEEALALGK